MNDYRSYFSEMTDTQTKSLEIFEMSEKLRGTGTEISEIQGTVLTEMIDVLIVTECSVVEIWMIGYMFVMFVTHIE